MALQCSSVIKSSDEFVQCSISSRGELLNAISYVDLYLLQSLFPSIFSENMSQELHQFLIIFMRLGLLLSPSVRSQTQFLRYGYISVVSVRFLFLCLASSIHSNKEHTGRFLRCSTLSFLLISNQYSEISCATSRL